MSGALRDGAPLTRAWAPGRVNIIGDHTDYTGGLVLPMAIDLGTTVEGTRGGDRIELTSDSAPEPVVIDLGSGSGSGNGIEDPSGVSPPWGRYVAGVVAELRTAEGFTGTVSTTLPIGTGLSSSAALEVAVALALGAPSNDPVALASLCQRAEQSASGVPCGIMDQLASVAGVPGNALLIDCHDLSIEPVPMPEDLAVVVVDSDAPRSLAVTAYAKRRAECEQAEALIGPLRSGVPGDEEAIADPRLRRRARHVLSENERVLAIAAALRSGALDELGDLMAASHRSLRDDFEVSIPAVDSLVERLCAMPGVYGARMTGGGFGGCVVALAEPGAIDEGWTVRAGPGAQLLD